jgi:hypothetical protein
VTAGASKLGGHGLYIPVLHHLAAWDYVFIREKGQKPGGTLGTRARADVLRVKHVREFGVLVLINRAGQVIDKHVDYCVPCTLPDLLGDTYAGLTRPSAKIYRARSAKIIGIGTS